MVRMYRTTDLTVGWSLPKVSICKTTTPKAQRMPGMRWQTDRSNDTLTQSQRSPSKTLIPEMINNYCELLNRDV